jgi:hypothetical protein
MPLNLWAPRVALSKQIKYRSILLKTRTFAIIERIIPPPMVRNFVGVVSFLLKINEIYPYIEFAAPIIPLIIKINIKK